MWMQLAIGVAKAAPGLLGAQGEKARIRARNKAKREQYDFLLQQRKRDWQNQLSIWGAKRNKYIIDVTENDLAAHRGYAQAQAGLNAVYDQAAQNNEAALIKFLNKHGTLAAKGRTGRGVGRINVMELAEMERAQGREFHKITKSREAYLANIEQIEGKARSRRRGLRSELGFAPVPQLAPPPPQMESENVTGKIAAAALEGIFAGLSSGVTAPGIPTGGSGGQGASGGKWITDGTGIGIGDMSKGSYQTPLGFFSNNNKNDSEIDWLSLASMGNYGQPSYVPSLASGLYNILKK